VTGFEPTIKQIIRDVALVLQVESGKTIDERSGQGFGPCPLLITFSLKG
jgi:hypothetical protein